MAFDLANQSDYGNADFQSAPILTNYATDTTRLPVVSDTTPNNAVKSLPPVVFDGTLTQQQVCRDIAQDGPPPIPQPQVNPFPGPTIGPGPVVNPFKPRDVNPNPNPFPQFVPETGKGPRPGPPAPGPDRVGPRDQPPAPGPFAPVPVSSSGFTADQVTNILADRNRALALHHGQKPSDKPGVGPIMPSPDGRNPFKPGPDVVKPGEKVKPEKTEFLEGGQFDQAVKAAKDSGRPLVISFTRPGCGYCTQLDEQSWPSQQSMMGDNAIRVKVNGAAQRELAQQYGVRGYPTTVVVNPNDMKVLGSKGGFVESDELGSFLQDAFKKMQGGG